MALEVGEIVSYLRLDDRDFQTKLGNAGNRLQSFGQTAGRLLQPLATGFTVAGGAAVGLTASLVKQGVAYNTLQQQSRAALTTILGSAEKANAQMDKLDDFARNSPFAKQVFITAQQQMLGFGIETEKVLPYLDALQNSVAATGGSNQELSELAYIMAQISSAGKITGEDLMQFGQRGVNAAELIGKEMGKTGGEIRDEITKGTLSADDALDALAAGMQDTYGGAAANVKNTWIGATDRIKGATRDIASALAAPFVDPNGGGKALDWANGFADLLRAVEAQARPLITELLPKILPLADGLTRLLGDLTRKVKDADLSGFVDELHELSEYAGPLTAVAAGMTAIAVNASPLAALGIRLNPFVAAVVALVATSSDLRGAAVDLLQSLEPLVPHFEQLARAGGDLANTVLSGLSDILVSVADGADEAGGPVDLLAWGIDRLSASVRLVNDIAAPLLGWLGDFVDAAGSAPGPILGVVAALVLMRNVDVGGIMSKAANATAAATETWRASQGTLQALGRDAGVMSTAMYTARAGVVALGGAMKTALVSNAPMLAITVLASAIGYFVQESAEAQAQVDELTQSFDELTGAATEQTAQLVTDQLNDSISRGDWEKLREIGVSYTDLMDAVTKGGEDAIDVRQRLLEVTQTGTQEEKEAALAALRALDDVGGAYQDASGDAKEYARQQREAADSGDALANSLYNFGDKAKDLADGLRAISDEGSSADDKLRALNEVLDILAGGAMSAEDAAFKYADTVRKTTEDVDQFAFSQDQLNGILNDDGSLNVQSEAAGRLRESFQGLRDRANESAVALKDAGDVEGISTNYQQLNADIDALGEQANLSDEQVNALKQSLGILPPEVMTDIVVNGEDAETDLNNVTGLLAAMPTETTSFIYGDSTDLDTKVDQADLRLAYLDGVKADPTLTGSDEENVAVVAAAVQRLDELDKMEPTPEILAEKGVLERVVNGAKLDLGSIKDKNVDVTAATHGMYDVDSLADAISRVRSKTATVTVRTVGVQSVMRAGRAVATSAWAEGGVLEPVTAFANGAEHHVAQIAAAGSNRLWAEPETGGEAYIPLAMAKRARSLAILQHVADRFGYVTVPVNTKRFADGSSGSMRPAQGGGWSVNMPVTIEGSADSKVVNELNTNIRHTVRDLAVTFPGR